MQSLPSLIILTAIPLTAIPGLVLAADRVDPVHHTRTGIAIDGYDPVAYFTDAKPVKGLPQFSHSWHGATWQFASFVHRDLFAADPERYAPQFGGYCAWAVSQNYIAQGDPNVWRIVDGKLFLNYNAKAKAMWEKIDGGQSVHTRIADGARNWPSLHK